MNPFFKYFFATLLAIFAFCIILVLFLVGAAGTAMSRGSAPAIADNAVLTIDLGEVYAEQPRTDLQSLLKREAMTETPGFYDLLRLIKYAKTDNKVKGILLKANGNANGFGLSSEIRIALEDFKKSGKFIIAHGDVISQKAYDIANVADKIYVSPEGGLQWTGFALTSLFLKGTLDKLDIKPQIFYAGKFKSATEPLRFEKMSEPNKLQTSVWLNELYSDFLLKTAAARKVDTATLHNLANTGAIRTAQDAVTHKLIDGVKYDDEVRDELKQKLKLEKDKELNFVSIGTYSKAKNDFDDGGDDIALIYANGNIVDGQSEDGNIGSETYIELLRDARLDKAIKAIVVRVNSGGGSALASENIWREMVLAKKEKPLIVSFGDVAASGGYYISCVADSIFAMPKTLTGSIGVFGVIPDMSSFFKNKAGVTFDGVTTGPLAKIGSADHPMSDLEKQWMQKSIEDIYTQFKKRVSDGRKKDTAYVETIAQGRVWSGVEAKQIGLIDKYGGLNDAIAAAASKAKLKKYEVKEYPKKVSLIERLLGTNKKDNISEKIKSEMGVEYFNVYKEMITVKQMCNTPQARLPFQFNIN